MASNRCGAKTRMTVLIEMIVFVVSIVCYFTEDQIPVMMMSIKDSVKAECVPLCMAHSC